MQAPKHLLFKNRLMTKEVKAKTIVVHPKWDGKPENGFDLAIVHLETPQDVNPLPQLYLAPLAYVGKIVTLVGFGRTGDGMTGNRGEKSCKLRIGENVIDRYGFKSPKKGSIRLTNKDCPECNMLLLDMDSPDEMPKNYFRESKALEKEMMTIYGDSGGGAFIQIDNQWMLVGIISSSIDVANPGEKAIHGTYGDASTLTRLEKMSEFLEKNGIPEKTKTE